MSGLDLIQHPKASSAFEDYLPSQQVAQQCTSLVYHSTSNKGMLVCFCLLWAGHPSNLGQHSSEDEISLIDIEILLFGNRQLSTQC